jgi:hypothetical protein
VNEHNTTNHKEAKEAYKDCCRTAQYLKKKHMVKGTENPQIMRERSLLRHHLISNSVARRGEACLGSIFASRTRAIISPKSRS